MILKASQRGGGMQLAAHLLKSENEHVEVHEIRGFVADDLKSAMKEAEAVARGTRCKQHLFSVSLNPPETEAVSTDIFEQAVERIEQANGLTGQPRVIVFHEKEGRRHAHAVWSRIDPETMTARQLSHFQLKLRDISKALYLERGWSMPRGFLDSREHDPRNFTLAEWQQAKRMGKDARALKGAIQECWAASDNDAAFTRAMEARGLHLAKGDARAHVIVTYEGEVISLARTVGVRAKGVIAKLGKPDTLRSVADTKAHIAKTVAPRLEKLLDIARAAITREMQPLEQRRLAMRERHAFERQLMAEDQKARSDSEARRRAERFRTGVAGLWDRLTGRHAALRRENEGATFAAYRRDRTQRDDLVADQLRERRTLQREIVAVRLRHAGRVEELHRDVARQAPGRESARDTLRSAFNDAATRKTLNAAERPRQILRGRGSGRDGPDLGR